MKLILGMVVLIFCLSVGVNFVHLGYFGMCPPQRLLFQKNAEGLLEPLSFLTEEQNLGTEIRYLVFQINDKACSAIGLDRW